MPLPWGKELSESLGCTYPDSMPLQVPGPASTPAQVPSLKETPLHNLHKGDCLQEVYTDLRAETRGVYMCPTETVHKKLDEYKNSTFESGCPGCYEGIFIKRGGQNLI